MKTDVETKPKEPCPHCQGYGKNLKEPKFNCIACMGSGVYPTPEAYEILRGYLQPSPNPESK